MNIDKFIIVLLTLIEKYSSQLTEKWMFIFSLPPPTDLRRSEAVSGDLSLRLTYRTSSPATTTRWPHSTKIITGTFLTGRLFLLSLMFGCLLPSPDYLTRTKWQDQTCAGPDHHQDRMSRKKLTAGSLGWSSLGQAERVRKCLLSK